MRGGRCSRLVWWDYWTMTMLSTSPTSHGPGRQHASCSARPIDRNPQFSRTSWWPGGGGARCTWTAYVDDIARGRDKRGPGSPGDAETAAIVYPPGPARIADSRAARGSEWVVKIESSVRVSFGLGCWLQPAVPSHHRHRPRPLRPRLRSRPPRTRSRSCSKPMTIFGGSGETSSMRCGCTRPTSPMRTKRL